MFMILVMTKNITRISMIASRAGWTRKKPRAHYIGVIRRKVNLKITWEVELNSAVFPLVRIFHFLFKPRDYKERIKHCLIFDKKNLSYHKGNATIWEIEYIRLGYLELPKDLSPSSLLENSYEVFVHTNDNDKYAFDSTLTPDKINELKSEIEQRAGSV